MNTAFCLVVVMLMILVRSDPRKYQDSIIHNNTKTIKSFFSPFKRTTSYKTIIKRLNAFLSYLKLIVV